MPSVYMYVVDRDFGFAPNPFHGFCSLATCKPAIRKSAAPGDWVIGMGGARLRATGRCIFAMRVTQKVTFDQYWLGTEFQVKKPVRNGSLTAMLGDNIYHRDPQTLAWHQSDSHHSMPDGTVNSHNLARDTNADAVLISRRFYYFGVTAPRVPDDILERIGYANVRSHRRLSNGVAAPLVEWLECRFRGAVNTVAGDPFDFAEGAKRYSVATNKVY